MLRPGLKQTIRTALAALVIALGGIAAPSLAAAANMGLTQSVGWGGSACEAIPAERRSLCVALEARTCSLASADHHWTCQGLVSGTCSLISESGDQELCRAITARLCSYASDPGAQALCRGVVQRDCRGLDQQAFAWCGVLMNAVPVRRG